MNPAVELSIIIVNWNSKAFLRRCLASIESRTGDIAYEIIVIDSGSFDGCGEMLSEHHPHVRFIQSARTSASPAPTMRLSARASVSMCSS